MWFQVGALMRLGPWPAVVGLGLVLMWTVVVVREFTRGQLVRSGRPFTARFLGFSIEVGAVPEESERI